MELVSSDQGRTTKAFECYNIGLELSKNKIWVLLLQHIINLLGTLKRVLECSFMSLKITEEIGCTKRIPTTLNSIGILYGNQGDSTRALEYLKKLEMKKRN